MPIFIKKKFFVNILTQELPHCYAHFYQESLKKNIYLELPHRHAHFYQESVCKYFNLGIIPPPCLFLIQKVWVNILIQELPHRHAHFYQECMFMYINRVCKYYTIGTNTADFLFHEMYTVLNFNKFAMFSWSHEKKKFCKFCRLPC